MASLWLYQAAAGATAFILTDALLPSWEWRGVDIAGTLLNVSGSILAGLVNGRARADDTAEIRTAISIVTGGFLAVWTSLAFTVEHAAYLAVASSSVSIGVVYLLGSILTGAAVYFVAYRLGRRWRISRKAMDWAKRGPLWLVSGAERVAFLSAVAAAAWASWMAGRHPRRLGWGIMMASAGCIIGNWFSGLNCGGEGRVKWGGWRCNAFAFAGVVCAGRYAASLESADRKVLVEDAFFLAFMGQGIGTLSGFADLSASAGDLALVGDYTGAAANIMLNVATATVALLARMKAERVFLLAAHVN